MNIKFFENIFVQLINPTRVQIGLNNTYNFAIIYSSQNINDTVDWFEVNSKKLEEYFQRNGYKWWYVIEKFPDEDGFVSLWTGVGLTKKRVMSFVEKMKNKSNGTFYVENGEFSTIDESKYRRELSAFEQAILNASETGFRILVP